MNKNTIKAIKSIIDSYELDLKNNPNISQNELSPVNMRSCYKYAVEISRLGLIKEIGFGYFLWNNF